MKRYIRILILPIPNPCVSQNEYAMTTRKTLEKHLFRGSIQKKNNKKSNAAKSYDSFNYSHWERVTYVSSI